MNFIERWWAASGPHNASPAAAERADSRRHPKPTLGDVFWLLNTSDTDILIKAYFSRSQTLAPLVIEGVSMFTQRALGHLYCDKIGERSTFAYSATVTLKRPDGKLMRIFTKF